MAAGVQRASLRENQRGQMSKFAVQPRLINNITVLPPLRHIGNPSSIPPPPPLFIFISGSGSGLSSGTAQTTETERQSEAGASRQAERLRLGPTRRE